VRYRIVDVFTDRPFAGNGLCVVLDPCREEVMQPLAREVNLSETTFPTQTGASAYSMRIFTPAAELPFAGHPSVGTAWVLGPGTWEQTTSGAVVAIEADATGAVMTQPDPELTEVDATGIAEALGLPGIEGAYLSVAGGTRHVLVPTGAAIDGLAPDPSAVGRLAEGAGGMTLCPVRRVDDRTLHVRVFGGPAAGIVEDPATGSAAGPIGILARRRWGTHVDVTILQGEEIRRPSRIEVHAEDGAIRVGGRVTAVAEGRFTADPN
jgi:trans-2,3-dihydro-3-hydroxyanthranilate isomerase